MIDIRTIADACPLAPRASSPQTHAQPVEAPPAEDTAEAVVESVVEAENSEEVRANPPPA